MTPAAPSPLTLLLIAPVVEEVVFRAGVQDVLRDAAGARAAIAATALLFAAAHLPTAPGPLALACVLPAFAIGAVYERTGRLAPCIALHGLANAAWIAAA